MDGVQSTNDDVIVVSEDAATEFTPIPLMQDFEEPETVSPVTVNNAPVETQPEPQQEPQLEPITMLAVPVVNTVFTTLTPIRLVSGADDNLTTAASDSDAEDENMDRRARRTRSRGRRSRRGRGRRSRSRSRRSRRRRSRSRRSRSRSDDSDFSVQIADEEISAELAANSSRGGQKTARGGRRARKVALSSRGGRKVTRGGRVSDKVTRGIPGGRKAARGSRRGRKTAKSAPARTMWSERLRSQTTYRNKKSKAK